MTNLDVFLTQVKDLTIANLKARYRKTLAGFIWVVLNPLIMFGVQSLVFKKFLRLEIPNFFLFLLSGLLPWIFLTQTIQMTTPILAQSGDLLKAFRINPLVLVVAQIIDNLINFIFAFFILFIPVYISSETGNKMGLFFLPVNIFLLMIGVSCMSIFLSVFNVFFRDTNFVLSFIISILFFVTPIFYPIEYIPIHMRWIVSLNPFYYFIEPFRISIVNFDMQAYFISTGKGLLVVSVMSLITYIFWKRKRNEFFYYL